MAVEPHEGEADGAGDGADGDDADVWRCKDCGAVQRDPDPPCERCWGTTFVSGEGVHVTDSPTAGPTGVSNSPTSDANLTAARVDHVKAASARTTLVAGGSAAIVWAARSLFSSSLVGTLLYGVVVLLGVFAALALTVTVLAVLLDVFDFTAGA